MLCRIYALDEEVKQLRPAEWGDDCNVCAEDAEWARDDAEQGEEWGQFRLGLAYGYGRGVPQDYAEAAMWFHKAADAGIVAAQVHLAIAYDKGQGVPQDYLQAHRWFNLAASSAKGDLQKYASDAREDLARKMTSKQIEEAQRLASEWASRETAVSE